MGFAAGAPPNQLTHLSTEFLFSARGFFLPCLLKRGMKRNFFGFKYLSAVTGQFYF